MAQEQQRHLPFLGRGVDATLLLQTRHRCLAGANDGGQMAVPQAKPCGRREDGLAPPSPAAVVRHVEADAA